MDTSVGTPAPARSHRALLFGLLRRHLLRDGQRLAADEINYAFLRSDLENMYWTWLDERDDEGVIVPVFELAMLEFFLQMVSTHLGESFVPLD